MLKDLLRHSPHRARVLERFSEYSKAGRGGERAFLASLGDADLAKYGLDSFTDEELATRPAENTWRVAAILVVAVVVAALTVLTVFVVARHSASYEMNEAQPEFQSNVGGQPRESSLEAARGDPLGPRALVHVYLQDGVQWTADDSVTFANADYSLRVIAPDLSRRPVAERYVILPPGEHTAIVQLHGTTAHSTSRGLVVDGSAVQFGAEAIQIIP